MRTTRREFFKAAAIGGAGLASLMRGRLVRTVSASDTYSSVVLAKAPAGYWRLGETGGPTAFDSSGNGYAGTYFGNPNFGQTGAIANDPDTGVGLNGFGSGDYVEIPDPAAAVFSQPTSGVGLTVEVWMRPDVLDFPGQTLDPYIHWLGKGMPCQYEWGLRFYSQTASRPNRISGYIWNPGDPLNGCKGEEGAGAYFQETLTPGVWMHIVVCYEPGDANTLPPAGVHIYRDGVHKQGPGPTTPGTLYNEPHGKWQIFPAHGSAPLRLGTRNDVNYTLNGALDEVAIYPRVLTPDEILENYNAGIS
jgi:hypothetical protein